MVITMKQMSENAILLESYKTLAGFLCESMGGPCSTVVYSINETEDDGKVLAVYGLDTGRNVGDSLTVFLKQVLQEFLRTGTHGLTHVDTEASTSEGRVKLNIFAIRNSKGKIIGLFILCTQIDLIYDLWGIVNQYLGYQPAEDTVVKAIDLKENDTISLSEYIRQLIQTEIDSFAIPVERMTIEEKRKIVHRLEKLEVFYVRDSVKITANLLGVSVPTVYRLLKKESKGITEKL